jgi:methylglutaconyl-CoA hydratase
MGLDLALEEVPQGLAKDLVLVGLDHRGRLPPGNSLSAVRTLPLHCAFVTAELVHSAQAGPVHTLTLDSPGNRNALSYPLLDQLAKGLAAAVSDPAARVVVLTATGSAFCSGADLAGADNSGIPATSRMPEILTLLRHARLPVIARVNGPARAGGIGLIAACDLAVAVARSTFAFSEVRVGVAPAMIMVPALEVVGRRFLARAVLTGETFGAEEAAHAGLLTAAVPDEAALDTWVHDAVASILRAAPGAVAATKALLRELPELSWAAGLTVAADRSARLFAGAEAAEGIGAFLHKRPPSWDIAAPATPPTPDATPATPPPPDAGPAT